MSSSASQPRSGGPILIALGSNIAPRNHLLAAVRLLAAHDRIAVRAASRVYESAPVDAAGRTNPAQENFLNAALWIETNLDPHALKYDVLRAVEARLGRVRTADKFASRPIDLDLALYGDLVLDGAADGLTLPDPELLKRAHLALPLADLAPGFRHPVTGQTLAEIAAPFRDDAAITVCNDLDLSCVI